MKLFVALLLALLPARNDAPGDARPTIHASFYPLEFLARGIVGDAARVVSPVPAGADPATWRPTRVEVRRMQRSRLVLVHHPAFEEWTGYVSLPLARTVVALRPLRERLLEYDEGAVHSHGPDGPPAHRGIDAHTWLDPELFEAEARVVLAALQAAFPGEAEAFAARYAELLAPLASWRAALERLTDELGPELLVANHPAYEYLAEAHGWSLENVELDPEEPPSGEARQRLAELVARGARLLLWESAPAPAVRVELERLGLTSVVYSPCETLAPERRAAGADFFSVMTGNATRLRRALREGR